MRLPKKGEKGFTLIELLIVVAILGVLAAVIIPNVGQFIGAGEEEARETEFSTVQTSVHSMMVDNQISSIPNAKDYIGGTAVNDMSKFPDVLSDNTTDGNGDGIKDDKVTDPEGYDYDFTTAPVDKPGYVLYGHDITGNDAAKPNPDQRDVNYVAMGTSTYYYTCESDGTVRQWASADASATGTEYTY